MLKPVMIKLLQKALTNYPNWEIVIAGGNFGGMVIRDDGIIDGLRRENMPETLRNIEYEGSRPQGSHFGDVRYAGPWRF